LLTGAAGVVGQALLEHLTGHAVVCLTHRRPSASAHITSIAGDITVPRLGLTRAAFADLARRIDCIVHAAAVTDFSQPAEVLFRANVDGTHHVLDLAATAGVPLYHVGSAFAHPSCLAASGCEPNAYQRSKWAAETLVRGSGVRATIVRPSIVMGNSRTGAIADFQGLHLMLGLLLKGYLPVIAAPATAYVDFVPQDLVAEAMISLLDRPSQETEYWLTAGSRALTVGAIVAIGLAQAPRLVDRALVPPRMVSMDTFERLIRPIFLPALPGHLRRTMRGALQLLHTCLAQPFPTSLPTLEHTHGLRTLPDQEMTLAHNLEYWARATGYVEEASRPRQGAEALIA
jgi:nucleoside-diphosphate-sugar epimerase